MDHTLRIILSLDQNPPAPAADLARQIADALAPVIAAAVAPLVATNQSLGAAVSKLTDDLDAAISVFEQDTSDADAKAAAQDAALAANAEQIASLQKQLDDAIAAKQTGAATISLDETKMQETIDKLSAIHNHLSTVTPTPAAPDAPPTGGVIPAP